jgi:hypothetical protein
VPDARTALAQRVLTPDEVKELRGGKVGPDPRFKGGDPQRWMERKTAIRQATKMIPRTPTLAKAHVADESTGTELYKAAAAERVDVPPGEPSPEGALEGVVEDPPGGAGTEGL